MPAELVFAPIGGYLGATVNGVEVSFDATVVCTPRLPPGFTALISNLDSGGGTGEATALAFPPQVFTTTGGVLAGYLLANDPSVLGPALAAAGITQLWYDVNFTKVSLGYQVPQNFSIPAPTTATPVSFTDPTVTRYAYGGVVPTVSLPAGITAFGVQLLGSLNLAAAQALLGITGVSDFLGQVSSQSAMLALTGGVGDYCYRTDSSLLYFLVGSPASTLSNWASGGAFSVPSSGIGHGLATRETPSGSVNGSNPTFTLAHTPVSGTEVLTYNGIEQTGGGVDYTISGATITFVTAPLSGQLLTTYWY
jgi:hypothetical protein